MTNTDVDSASVNTASGPKTVALCTPLAGTPVLGCKDVVVAYAVFLKVALVVTGCRNGFVFQWNGYRDLTVLTRISNTYHPRLTTPVTEQP